MSDNHEESKVVYEIGRKGGYVPTRPIDVNRLPNATPSNANNNGTRRPVETAQAQPASRDQEIS